MTNIISIVRRLFDEVYISLEESLGLSSKTKTIFDEIIGHDDIKEIFIMALGSQKKPSHFLLVGPPGTSKTMFLEKILNQYSDRAYFTLGAHSSKAGMINTLFEKRPRYLLVDEIEHMPLSDQTVLLSLMQSGIISETKVRKTRSTQLKTWVFATSNGTKKLSEALLSRFMVIELEKYSYEEFRDISVHLLVNSEEVGFDLANTIVEEVYKNFKNPNIRDIIKIGRIARNRNDVLMIVRRVMKEATTRV
jgi:MoxR-like ATPase